MRHVTERAAQLIEAAMLEYIDSRQHEAQKSTRVYNQIRLMRKALAELKTSKTIKQSKKNYVVRKQSKV